MKYGGTVPGCFGPQRQRHGTPGGKCGADRKSGGRAALPSSERNASPGERKQRCGRTIPASTLAETLVMMLVAGIVFLAVMDGLTLFTRLQVRRAEALLAEGRRRDGFFRLEALTAQADSLRTGYAGVEIYRGGTQALLSLSDSALVYSRAGFRDTLLRGVAALRLAQGEPDTLKVALARGITLRFGVSPPAAEVYRRSVDRIEEGYGYEE